MIEENYHRGLKWRLISEAMACAGAETYPKAVIERIFRELTKDGTRRPSDRTELANKYEYIRSSILSDSERLRAAKKDHRRLLKAARASRAWIKAGAPA